MDKTPLARSKQGKAQASRLIKRTKDFLQVGINALGSSVNVEDKRIKELLTLSKELKEFLDEYEISEVE